MEERPQSASRKSVNDFDMLEYVKVEDKSIYDHFPRWATVLTVFILLSITIGAIVCCIEFVSYERKSNYKEQCNSRKCSSSFSLECINGSCECDSSHYFDTKCHLRKNYMEYCYEKNFNCINDANLLCLDGVCKCDNKSYWNGHSCLLKQIYDGPCQSSDIQCVTSAYLYCDIFKGKCSCKNDR